MFPQHYLFTSSSWFLYRLSHEWLAYISRTHKLRKVFVSVKGIYYQVHFELKKLLFKEWLLLILVNLLFLQSEVQGQKITWLAPHSMQQVLPEDIDYNVMLTYLEFNEVCYFSSKSLFIGISLIIIFCVVITSL